MKDSKWMQLPRNVVIGPGVIHDVLDVCLDLKLIGNGLVLTGKKTEKMAGKLVVEILENTYNISVKKIKEPTYNEMEKIVETGKDLEIGFIIAAGGGKVIDVAKLASTKLDVPFISIPTSASHDGIASSRASLKDGVKNTSIEAKAPEGVIADTSIIASSPIRLTLSGCGDILANKTAVLDWRLAHRVRGEPYSEYAAALSEMTSEIIINSPEGIKEGIEAGVRKVVKALISSGVAMSIAGSSRPASGSEHMFSHALDMISKSGALHGEQCGVGAIIMMYLHGKDWRQIRDVLRSFGAPTTASELGVDEGDIIEALIKAHTIRPERYTILGNGLTRTAAKRASKKTGVI